LFDTSENFLPVGTYLFGMETEHGIAIAGIAATNVEDGRTGSMVDGWHKNLGTACLTRPLDYSIHIVAKLFTIQMAVRIYVIKN
jgi:hypothetical protein